MNPFTYPTPIPNVAAMRRRVAIVILMLSLLLGAAGIVMLLAPDSGVSADPVSVGELPGAMQGPGSSSSSDLPPATDPATNSASSTTAPENSPVPDAEAAADAAAIPAPPPIPITSGRPEDLDTDRAPVPVGLTIGAIDVDAPVQAVGYDQRRDAMEIPRDASVVGWYRYGPSPGEPGSSVLAAHVTWGGQRGAFYELRNLSPGEFITVEYDDGTNRAFEIVAIQSYPKPELPVDRIFARNGDPILTLITCGGAYDPDAGSYDDNVVAYAVEVAPVDPTGAD